MKIPKYLNRKHLYLNCMIILAGIGLLLAIYISLILYDHKVILVL